MTRLVGSAVHRDAPRDGAARAARRRARPTCPSCAARCAPTPSTCAPGASRRRRARTRPRSRRCRGPSLRHRREWKRGQSFVLSSRPRDDEDRILGRVALGGVLRGAFQNAYLGLLDRREHQGQGLMTEAVRATTGFAFRRRAAPRAGRGDAAQRGAASACSRRSATGEKGWRRGTCASPGAGRTTSSSR